MFAEKIVFFTTIDRRLISVTNITTVLDVLLAVEFTRRLR